jgi:thioredoxin
MKNSMLMLSLIFVMSCKAQTNANVIDPVTFNEAIKSPGVKVIDVRTPDEFAQGSISGAQNFNYRAGDFKEKITALDHAATYYVYCLSGGRSGEAARYMRENGFEKVYELKGGTLAWTKAGLPLSTKSEVTPKADQYTLDQFKQMSASDKKVLFDFYAPWCGPCKQMMPILEQIGKEYKGQVTIIKIDIDQNKDLVRTLGIDEIPFFKLFKEGKESGNYIGQMDKASFDRILK